MNGQQNAHMILPGLWLGNKGASEDVNWLRSNQIGAVFNCTKDLPFVNGPWNKYRVPVDDSLEDEDIRNLELWSYEITFKIARELSQGHRVLVHCYAGMQRSAASVAMFLISQYRCTADQAIEYIQRKRPIAFRPGVNFERSIRGFENSFKRMILERNAQKSFPIRPLPTDMVSWT